jgi:hypothetical protein
MLVLVLMVANWALEAWKWKALMARVEDVTFALAFKAVIAGTAIGLITPNRVGEFAGRVLFLAPEHRVSGSFATSLGSISQFVVTLICGSIALLFDPFTIITGAGHQVIIGLMWTMLAVSLVALAFYFNTRLLRSVFMALPFLRRYGPAADVLDRFTIRDLTGTLLLSALRYGVFTVQFILLLAVRTDLPSARLAFGVPVVYLITTLVPTVMLTELGVRGSVAVAVLANGEGDAALVFLSTLLLWAINLALPAIVGSVLLLVARIRTSEPGP